jgi:hypothetical protein
MLCYAMLCYAMKGSTYKLDNAKDHGHVGDCLGCHRGLWVGGAGGRLICRSWLHARVWLPGVPKVYILDAHHIGPMRALTEEGRQFIPLGLPLAQHNAHSQNEGQGMRGSCEQMHMLRRREMDIHDHR